MATTFKALYANAGSALTVSLNSLATNGYRQSDEVDNTTVLALDSQIILYIQTTASGVVATGYVPVFAFGQVGDATPIRTDTMGAADAAVDKPANSRLIGVLQANSTNGTYAGGPWSVAAAFGGVLPRKWGVIVGNVTGAAFSNASSANQCFFINIQGQGV